MTMIPVLTLDREIMNDFITWIEAKHKFKKGKPCCHEEDTRLQRGKRVLIFYKVTNNTNYVYAYGETQKAVFTYFKQKSKDKVKKQKIEKEVN